MANITENDIFEIIRKHDAYLTTSKELAKEIFTLFDKIQKRLDLQIEINDRLLLNLREFKKDK